MDLPVRSVGRPRSFLADEALDFAVERFRRIGYDRSSVRDLASDIGISQSSLFAAFGCKEQIFSSALDRYEAKVGLLDMRSLAEAPSLEDGVAQLALVTISRITKRGAPRGCMVLGAGISPIPKNETVLKDLRERRRRFAEAIAQALRRHMSSQSDAAATGQFLAAALNGLAVQALDGLTRAELKSNVPFVVAGCTIRAAP